jgi:hypothetical protein
MKFKKRIDFPPREFSSVEITSLLMLAAEAQTHIDNIGTSLIALSNAPHLDKSTIRLIHHMSAESKRARVKIDRIMSSIAVEEMLIDGAE